METVFPLSQLKHINLVRTITSFAIFLIIVLVLLFTVGFKLSTENLLLVMVAFGVGIVSVFPPLISMFISRQFDLFHPLFYSAWFFFIPNFSLASIFIVSGVLVSWDSSLVADVFQARMMALGLAYLATIGLSLGYFLPFGRKLARLMPVIRVMDVLPRAQRTAAIMFLFIGIFALFMAFREGLYGYQFNANVSRFEAVFASFSSLFIISQGMIWFGFFKTKRGWRFWGLFTLLITVLIAVISGSRGSLFHSVILIVAGYQYAQKKHRFIRIWKWIIVLLFALFFGMIVGSTFRQNTLKNVGRTSSLAFEKVFELSSATIQDVQDSSLKSAVEFGAERIVERIAGIMPLAVIVDNAERLKNAEERVGIHNNIFRELMISFIPRFIWPSKPVVNTLELVGNLYFQTKFNSPALTYMGDLYRNFGVWGVLPGMMIVGVVLRFLYAWLVERQSMSPLRVGLYMYLGFVVNYESSYSGYFPALIRALFIAGVAIMFINMTQYRVLIKER